MRHVLNGMTGLFLLITFSTTTLAGWDPNKPDEVDEAQVAITAFKATDPDLETFFDKAYGYAVDPSVGKAGMCIGGA